MKQKVTEKCGFDECLSKNDTKKNQISAFIDERFEKLESLLESMKIQTNNQKTFIDAKFATIEDSLKRQDTEIKALQNELNLKVAEFESKLNKLDDKIAEVQSNSTNCETNCNEDDEKVKLLELTMDVMNG